MKTISARYLLQFSTQQLWDMLIDRFKLKFDDGEIIETNYREVLYSSYLWKFHQRFPQTPLLSRHLVTQYIKGGALAMDTHIDMLTTIFKDMSNHTTFKDVYERDELAVKLVYEVTNEMYNDLTVRCQEFVGSLDILDLIEVVDHPKIKNVLDTIERTDDSIFNAYRTIMSVVKEKGQLDENAVVKAARAGLINSNQLLQCVGPRGRMTDMDSSTFHTPITNGYLRGLTDLHDSMTESRSAAKAIYFTEKPLQDGEYFSRRLQLLCMGVERLHLGDCGSDKYLIWYVVPPKYEYGIMTYGGDLKNLVGKYYLDEESNTLLAIEESDKHLIGKTLKIRSPVAGCNHQDPHGICSTCFGKMSNNSVPDSNLGHNAVGIMAKIIQSIISTKHYDGNAIVDNIVLSNEDKRFMTVGNDGGSYILQSWLKDANAKLYVRADAAFALNDVNMATDVGVLNITRVSIIEAAGIKYNDKKLSNVEVHEGVSVKYMHRKSSFTKEFLAYVKTRGWTIEDSDYCFNLDKWDFSLPVFILPNVQYSMSDHADSISDIIESKVDALLDRVNESPASKLAELFEVMNSKISANLSLVEIMIYGSMSVSVADGDFRLPKANTGGVLGVAAVTMENRSLSTAYSNRDITKIAYSAQSYFKGSRPDSVMDVYIKTDKLNN